MTLPILLLAAGASSRMRGGDKLLEEVEGKPCLETMARRAIATGEPVIVLVPRLDHPRVECLQGLEVTCFPVPDAAQGMSRSLKRGINALPAHAKGVMVLPADMPEITSGDMKAMQTAFATANALALRAVTDTGQHGHPIIFDASLFEEFQHLTGDKGAQPILSKLGGQLAFHPLQDQRARLDLDTPEDWAAWRSSQSKT
jgi:CTP:molybdopterin cytidylyltransferase MocA